MHCTRMHTQRCYKDIELTRGESSNCKLELVVLKVNHILLLSNDVNIMMPDMIPQMSWVVKCMMMMSTKHLCFTISYKPILQVEGPFTHPFHAKPFTLEVDWIHKSSNLCPIPRVQTLHPNPVRVRYYLPIPGKFILESNLAGQTQLAIKIIVIVS